MTFADRGTATRRPLLYAASLAALLIAAGCTAGTPTPNASTAVPTTTSSSATTTATATPTTTAKPTPTVDPVIAKIPAAARPETIEGAAAFATFYFKSLNDAFRTADPAVLQGLATTSCTMCTSLAQGVADVRAAGNRYDGDLAKVNYASTSEFTPTSRKVLISLSQRRIPIVNSAGDKVDTTRAANLSFVATMDYDERWVITRLQKAAS
ncbi:DUF6318 family protein [Humibacillus xanthopallidus]|uniref:DUF6318 family protein n=1 Tax=Humibacillus xanthopallidus TaxID=412689 RepID=UPI00384C9ACC